MSQTGNPNSDPQAKTQEAPSTDDEFASDLSSFHPKRNIQRRRSLLNFPFDSLKNRNFARLWISMFFSMGGIQMQMLARGYFVYEITGSAKLLGVVSAGGALPVLVLSLAVGVLADGLPRKRLSR